MSKRKPDNFQDLPILAELGELLERRFTGAQHHTTEAARPSSTDDVAAARPPTARRAAARPRLRATAAAVPVVFSILVAAVVAVVALTSIRHAPAPAGRQPASHANAFPEFPNLTTPEARDIIGARTATIAHDRACSPFVKGLPIIDRGSPSPALTSVIGVLRQPATDADKLPELLQRVLSRRSPGTGREIYVNDVRLARTVAGTRFYIVPMGNASGLKPVPAGCEAREIATLKHTLAHTPEASRTRILALQRQYLAWETYDERYPQGIAEAELLPARLANQAGSYPQGIAGAQLLPARLGNQAGSFGSGSTVAAIQNGDAGLGFMRANHSLYLHGIVPSGVATVTLHRTANPSYTTTATVINNVWVARLPINTVNAAFPLEYIWRSAQGTVIKTLQ